MAPVADTKVPALIAFGMIAAGVVIAALGHGGVLHGSIGGAILSALGAIPACFGMWKGIQQETQGTLAMSVFAVLLAFGVAALLIVLRIIYWVT
jgi:hypothetical protein